MMPTALHTPDRRARRHSVKSMWLILGLAAAMPLSAQISLSTIVSMAQRKSAAVRLAEADVHKAEAVLAETHDVYIPSVNLEAGLPAAPALGFTGGIPSIVSGTVESQVFSLPHIQYERAARAGVESSILNLKSVREQVALDASTLYIELDTVTREQEAATLQSTYAQHLVEIEEQRSEAGIDSLNLYLDARLSAANIKLKQIHLESRKRSILEQLAALTGLPASAISTISSSIPQIPRINPDTAQGRHYSLEAAQQIANSKNLIASGDAMSIYSPQVGFSLQYNRHTTLLNDTDSYYARPIPTNNFSAGFTFIIPLFDMTHRGKARETAAEALRARIEAEQAQHQNDLNIVTINNSLNELEVLAEISDLRQQLAGQELKSVQAEIQYGNGSSSTPQTSPRMEELARIAERDKYIEALDAAFDLNKARLNLIEALGHMEEWLSLIDAAKPANDSK